jgi:hypothetical protein
LSEKNKNNSIFVQLFETKQKNKNKPKDKHQSFACEIPQIAKE